MTGHAIECRICAEDPARGFLPSTGKVKALYLPAGNLGMRIDSALYPGATVSPYYDSMIAKVVAHASTRAATIAKLTRLLNELVISGVTTNQAFHLALLRDPGFLAGTASTNYLETSFLPTWQAVSRKEAADEAV